MSEDTKLQQLIINTLSPEQFEPITPSDTEIYLVEDDVEYASVDELNQGLATKQDVIPDLDIYVKNTDFATTTAAGVIRANTQYGIIVNQNNGVITSVERNQSQYDSAPRGMVMSKGTLENIKENLVTSVGDEKYAKADELNNPYSLFDCKFADHLLNNASWLRADTFDWHSGDVYVDAYNLLVEEYNNGTEETYPLDNIVFRRTQSGFKICNANQEQKVLNRYNNNSTHWFYILDTANKRFKLPRTKWGFKGLRDKVGDYINESLPNITGTFSPGVCNGHSAYATGAFQGATGTGFAGAGTGVDQFGYTFDASRSSSTYQNGAPVQECGTQMYLYFYVGETVQNANLIDAGRIAEQLTNKVDVDSSWGFPSNRYIDLTLGASGSSYTAPANGWVMFKKSSNAVNQFVYLNSHNIESRVYSVGTQEDLEVYIPITKNITFTVHYSAGGNTKSFKFIYAEGAN